MAAAYSARFVLCSVPAALCGSKRRNRGIYRRILDRALGAGSPKALGEPRDGSRMQPACPGLTQAELRGDAIEPLALQVVASNQLAFLVRQVEEGRLHDAEHLRSSDLVLGARLRIDGDE